MSLEPEVIGKIEIFVFRDGKMPARVEGLDDFQQINVLSSLISHINRRMADKPDDFWKKYFGNEVRKRLYVTLLAIFGSDDGFPIINALAWTINRVSQRMARDKTKLILPEEYKPEVNLVQ
jgi:hypothetical protein